MALRLAYIVCTVLSEYSFPAVETQPVWTMSVWGRYITLYNNCMQEIVHSYQSNPSGERCINPRGYRSGLARGGRGIRNEELLFGERYHALHHLPYNPAVQIVQCPPGVQYNHLHKYAETISLHHLYHITGYIDKVINTVACLWSFGSVLLNI